MLTFRPLFVLLILRVLDTSRCQIMVSTEARFGAHTQLTSWRRNPEQSLCRQRQPCLSESSTMDITVASKIKSHPVGSVLLAICSLLASYGFSI